MMIAVFNPEDLHRLLLDYKALLIQGNGHNCRDAQQQAHRLLQGFGHTILGFVIGLVGSDDLDLDLCQ